MQDKKAFTLAEMLVVIMIIGLIFIIAVPNVVKLINNQTKTAYDVHMNLVEKALDLYTVRKSGDFKEYEVNQCLILDYSELITAGFLKEDKIMCDGKLELTKENNNSYDYEYFLNCEDKNEQVLSEYSSNSIPSECIVMETNSSGDASLKRLAVEGYTIAPVFDPERLEYSVTVPNEVTSLKVIAEVNDKDARYRVTKNTGFVVGENTIEVKVTAANGNIRIYKIKVTREKSNNAYLSNLSAKDCIFDQEFSSTTFEYTCTMTNDKTSTVVDATAVSSDSKIEITGNYDNLVVGDNNIITIKVTSEDALKEEEYQIKISRDANSNPALKDLTLEECDITPDFNKDVKEYRCSVDNSVTSVNVTAIPEESVTQVNGSGTHNLTQAGDNEIIISTTAEDGVTTDEYKITVTRAENDDARLGSLNITGCTLDKSFDKDETSYTCTVPYPTTEVTLSATQNTTTSTIESGLGTHSLVVGENVITIKVKAESGIYQEYYITVTRQQDTTNTLKSLEVEGYSLDPTFDPNTTSYTVNMEENNGTIIAEPTSEVAYIVGMGDFEIDWGTTTKTVVVISQSGSIKNYTITLNNPRPTAPEINTNSTDWIANSNTVSIKTAGTAPYGGGVQYYEYYISTSSTAPNDTTEPTGNTSNTTSITASGIRYIWYRTVSNHYNVSEWSNMLTIKVKYRANEVEYKNSTYTTCTHLECAITELNTTLTNRGG